MEKKTAGIVQVEQRKRVAIVYKGIGEHSSELLGGITQYAMEHRRFTIYNIFTTDVHSDFPFRSYRLMQASIAGIPESELP